MKVISTIIFSTLFLSACATSGNGTREAWNKVQAKQKSPVRLVKVDGGSDKSVTKLIEDWAGVPGNSAINQRYQKMTFDNIQQQCGYGQPNFIEYRIVNHGEQAWEEVWLFNDPKSHRDDKVSGLTVFFQYDPETNRTGIKLIGECHTDRGTSFTFND